MDLSPSPERREWLLDRLRRLIRRRGHRRFLRGRIFEPIDADFPDRWTPDRAGVGRLVQRLMRHAGLGRLPLDVRLADAPRAVHAIDGDGRPGSTSGAAAWFHGIEEDGRCRFGVDEGELRDPMTLVGVLSHEVAHAYRHHFVLQSETNEEEEQLTDLTTVFLGFGACGPTQVGYRIHTGRPFGVDGKGPQRVEVDFPFKYLSWLTD